MAGTDTFPDTFRVCIPMNRFTHEGVRKFNKYIKEILSNICKDWDGVEFLDDTCEGRVFFTETGVDFRPPFLFSKHEYNYLKSCGSPPVKQISLTEVKTFSRKFYKEATKALGFDFDIYISVDFDDKYDYDEYLSVN